MNEIETYLNNFREGPEIDTLSALELDERMNQPEMVLYIKAFRLKHFNRCPKCDEVMVYWYDTFNRIGYNRCVCGLELNLTDQYIWSHKGSMDLVVLELVKGVMDGSNNC